MSDAAPPSVIGRVATVIGITHLILGTVCIPLVLAVSRFFPEAASRKALPELRQYVSTCMYRRLALASALAVPVLLLLTDWLSLSKLAVIPMIGLLWIQSILKLETFFLTAATRHVPSSVLTTLSSVGQPIIAVIAIKLIACSETSIIAGYLLADACVLTLAVTLVRRDGLPTTTSRSYPGAKNNYKTLGAEVHRYARPLTPLAALSWTLGMSDRYLLAGLVDLDSVGIYSVGYSLVSRPMMMVQASLETLLRPRVFHAVSRHTHRKTRNLFTVWIALTVVASSGIAMAVTVIAQPATLLLVSGPFQKAAGLMKFFALGYVFANLTSVIEGYLQAAKRPQAITSIRLFGALSSIATAAPLIYFFDMIGAALATPAYMGLQLIYAATLLRRRIIEESAEPHCPAVSPQSVAA